MGHEHLVPHLSGDALPSTSQQQHSDQSPAGDPTASDDLGEATNHLRAGTASCLGHYVSPASPQGSWQVISKCLLTK